MAIWSDLMTDILEHITRFLALPDQHRFSAVCHNWREVAKQKRYPPVPMLPWLVLEEDRTTKKRNFYNLSERRHYSIDIPELYEQHIVGSKYGWLITVDKNKTLKGRLLNPFTREFYDLPRLPYFDGAICGYVADSDWHWVQKLIIYKAVLLCDPREISDFIVVIIFGGLCQLAIWRPGDAVWTIAPKIIMGIADVICFQGNIYALGHDSLLYDVDVGSDILRVTKICLVSQISNKRMRYLPHSQKIPAARYLLEFKGKLFVVEQFIDTKNLPVEIYRVFHFNLKEKTINELGDIDDLALFLGKYSSVVIADPNKHSGCVKNSVYFPFLFTDNYKLLQYVYDLGVYNLVEKTAGQYRYINGGIFYPPQEIFVWMTPNPSCINNELFQGGACFNC